MGETLLERYKESRDTSGSQALLNQDHFFEKKNYSAEKKGLLKD